MCGNCTNCTNCKTSIWNVCSGTCSGACPSATIDHTMIDAVDMSHISQCFLDEYYPIVANKGWNKTMHFYAADARICCNSNIYDSCHDFLAAMSGDYVQRANYQNLQANWSPIDHRTALINVFGEIQLVSFTGLFTGVGHFSDTFVIKAFDTPSGLSYAVINHSLYIS